MGCVTPLHGWWTLRLAKAVQAAGMLLLWLRWLSPRTVVNAVTDGHWYQRSYDASGVFLCHMQEIIGVPANHPFLWDFPWHKPSILGYAHDYGNLPRGPPVVTIAWMIRNLGADENERSSTPRHSARFFPTEQNKNKWKRIYQTTPHVYADFPF